MRAVVRQGEGRQTAYTEALVFPGQILICQVDLLVDHLKLGVWVELSHHLSQVLHRKRQFTLKVNSCGNTTYSFTSVISGGHNTLW